MKPPECSFVHSAPEDSGTSVCVQVHAKLWAHGVDETAAPEQTHRTRATKASEQVVGWGMAGRVDYRASEGTSCLRAGMRGRAKVLRQEPVGHAEAEPEGCGARQREPGKGPVARLGPVRGM